jgi:hypothetical protein
MPSTPNNNNNNTASPIGFLDDIVIDRSPPSSYGAMVILYVKIKIKI